MANPTTNFGWVMPAATDLVTDLPADFDVFGQAVDTDFVGLKGGTTGQVLAKNSATDLDFVWSADAAGMTNPMTTTADIIYSSSGSTPARLGIGSTSDVLTVAGGVPTWAAPAAGGGMTLLSTTTLSGASTTISSISQDYKELSFVIIGATQSAAARSFQIGPNGDYAITNTIENYGSNTTASANATVSSWLGSALNWIYPVDATNVQSFTISNYTSTTAFKPFLGYGMYVASSDTHSFNSGGIIKTTSAISSLAFKFASTDTLTAGTVLLYGVS